jgi:hypothetical protein
MIAVELDHCHIVSESLAGLREPDEQAQASLAVLSERLERLKKASGAFSGVAFSPYVEKLKSRASTIGTG